MDVYEFFIEYGWEKVLRGGPSGPWVILPRWRRPGRIDRRGLGRSSIIRGRSVTDGGLRVDQKGLGSGPSGSFGGPGEG